MFSLPPHLRDLRDLLETLERVEHEQHVALEEKKDDGGARAERVAYALSRAADRLFRVIQDIAPLEPARDVDPPVRLISKRNGE